MPAFQKSIAFKIARGVRAYLNLEVGLTRRSLAEVQWRPTGSDTDGGSSGLQPENIIWIFGSGRSGSTWLSSMMEDIEGHAVWGEPWVGALFGNYYYRAVEELLHKDPQFILGLHKKTWLGSIRHLVLNSARANFPGLSGDEYLTIKEPNGSIGAPLMMEALPESRLIFLVRDPRDVVASSMDARSEGGWNYERHIEQYLKGRSVPADKNPDAFVKKRAERYLEGMSKVKEAYDAHRGPKTVVKYEDLRSDTLGTMKKMYSTLRVEVDEEELERVIEKHSWENIPELEKGQGKFYRKATPGGWSEDLTPEQAGTVERITAPLLKEFYPG
ncbi:MAG: sulfotransferase [Actinomycetota bacterium]|nr:sulfotransferase [Actinomycetota bacterium]